MKKFVSYALTALGLSIATLTPLAVAASNQPDLTVKSMRYEISGINGNPTLYATICNNGSGVNFSGLKTEFFIHETYNLSGVSYFNVFSGNLNAGQCTEVFTTFQDGSHVGHKTINITVDSDHKFDEISEANNKLGQNIYLGSSTLYGTPTPSYTPTPQQHSYGYYDYGRPYYENYGYNGGRRYYARPTDDIDLVLKNVGISQNVADQYIVAEICNEGRDDASDSFTIDFVVDNKRFSKESTGVFLSNTCRDFSMKLDNLNKSGYFWVDVVADASNRVPEVYEGNNTASRYLYVHETNLLPDLALSSISFDTHRDGGVNAIFEYCNYGGKTSQTYEIMLKVADKRFTSKESRLNDERCVASNLYLGNLAGGTYSYEFILDRANVIEESNEDNNTRTGQFSVSSNTQPTTTIYNGDLVKSYGSNRVYYVNNGYRYWIPNMDVFNHNGYSWAMIRTVDQSVINSLQDGGEIGYSLYASGTLIKTASNPNVFIMDGTSKRLIQSEAEFNTAGYNWNNVITVSEGYMSAVPNK